ncbi:hypothetical protein LNV23_20570 [Paucibacter sp. DJ1R-11]|uniref:hypothetical protein n=1 Tax=Paucibacter sp. DJ1R-11 TaxID=2893556 RepID=UPI0021E45225|nr:hypothetical protein [Paucibacter sp. DJ1R-11]MCV2365850.1 hypothetical protein [Paucibacter sp. DJ1R-11]
MKRVIGLFVALCALCGPAHAWWVVKASWWVDEGVNSREYEGKGTSQDIALQKARAACLSGRSNTTVGLCQNAPLRISFAEIKDPPGGAYLKSCKDCAITDGDVIVCSACPPKRERRELDLKQCQSRAIIENCGGDLHCSACPKPPPKKGPPKGECQYSAAAGKDVCTAPK